MKLSVLFILGGMLKVVFAGKQKGAVERVIYYAAYLSEEITGGPYTIAPGCKGSQVGPLGISRCNFGELLSYIWTERDDAEKRMTPKPPKFTSNQMARLDDPNKFARLTVEQITGVIQAERYTDGNGKSRDILGWVDPKNLMVGETDWYTALSKISEPIQRGKSNPVYNPPWKDKIYDLGKRATEILPKLRLKDIEDFRLRRLNQLLGWQVSTVTLSTGIGNQAQFRTYSWEATKLANPNRPDLVEVVQKALSDVNNANAVSIDHMRAYNAALENKLRLSCAVPH